MRKLVLFLIAGLFSLPLMAQDAGKLEAFIGYQYLSLGGSNSAFGTGGSQGLNGFNAALAYNGWKFLGVEGDFSGTYANIQGVSTHFYTYSGGPVLFANVNRLRPFAHVLFGGATLSGSESGVTVSWNGLTAMAGGGVDFKATPHLALRVVQFDWLYYHFGSKTIATVSIPSFSGSSNYRFSTGIVFRF
jgi:hypothetical protein